MDFFKFVFVFFLFSFSIPVFPQPNVASDENDPALNIRKERAAGLKADILREIQALSRKEQAQFYAQLGSTYWQHDRKEGIYWLTKAIEMAVGPPAADYKDDKEKLTGLWNLLSAVLEKDAVLSGKLIAKIKEIKIDESNLELLEEANQAYILIAEQLLSRKKDEKLAFDFAMLSLKGKRPAINWNAYEFFSILKVENENLANAYFAKMLETVKTSGDSTTAQKLLFRIDSYFVRHNDRFKLSDSQLKDLFQLMLPYVQREARELSLKKEDDCDTTKLWGIRFLDDYKRLLPEKLPIIEHATNVCNNSDVVQVWLKPNFLKKPLKTSQDFLDFAREINDKKIQSRYQKSAAILARGEKNYRLAVSILDGIAKEFREIGWGWLKIEMTSKLIDELFKHDDFVEIQNVLESAPPEFRPFIVISSLNSLWTLKEQQKEFVLDLMNQARADFNKIDKFADPKNYSINPTRFAILTHLYVKFGFYEEAIASFEESIKALNLVAATLPAEYKERNFVPVAWTYSRFQSPRGNADFFNQYFDRIYESVGRIENSRTRIYERLVLLEKTLAKPPNRTSIPGIPSNIK